MWRSVSLVNCWSWLTKMHRKAQNVCKIILGIKLRLAPDPDLKLLLLLSASACRQLLAVSKFKYTNSRGPQTPLLPLTTPDSSRFLTYDRLRTGWLTTLQLLRRRFMWSYGALNVFAKLLSPPCAFILWRLPTRLLFIISHTGTQS
jgi:hypothetical protein